MRVRWFIFPLLLEENDNTGSLHYGTDFFFFFSQYQTKKILDSKSTAVNTGIISCVTLGAFC